MGSQTVRTFGPVLIPAGRMALSGGWGLPHPPLLCRAAGGPLSPAAPCQTSRHRRRRQQYAVVVVVDAVARCHFGSRPERHLKNPPSIPNDHTFRLKWRSTEGRGRPKPNGKEGLREADKAQWAPRSPCVHGPALGRVSRQPGSPGGCTG